jgi:hypothetical protein
VADIASPSCAGHLSAAEKIGSTSEASLGLLRYQCPAVALSLVMQRLDVADNRQRDGVFPDLRQKGRILGGLAIERQPVRAMTFGLTRVWIAGCGLFISRVLGAIHRAALPNVDVYVVPVVHQVRRIGTTTPVTGLLFGR